MTDPDEWFYEEQEPEEPQANSLVDEFLKPSTVCDTDNLFSICGVSDD